jgi:hypothetical protein
VVSEAHRAVSVRGRLRADRGSGHSDEPLRVMLSLYGLLVAAKAAVSGGKLSSGRRGFCLSTGAAAMVRLPCDFRCLGAVGYNPEAGLVGRGGDYRVSMRN